MTETIAVYFKPLGEVDGVTYYHENLVYTNSSGQTFVTAAYASNANANVGGTSGALANFTAAAADVATNSPSIWGTLKANTNTSFNPNDTNPNDANTSIGVTRDSSGNLYSSETIASGASLSSQWATINSSETNIANDNLTYSPLTQNSNSTADSALQLAGLTPPSDTGMMSAHWAPAAGTDLTFSCFKDGSGNTVLDLNDKNTTNTMDLITSPTGNSTNVTVSTGSLVDDAEAATTNVDGSQTDNLTGYNSNGSTKFTQDTTVATNGQVSATITGQGDNDYVTGASVSISTGASATVQGGSDVVTVSSGASANVDGNSNTTILNLGALSANIQGNSDYISDGNGIGFTSSGVSDQVNIGGYYLGQATASFSSSTSLDSIKLSNNNTLCIGNGSQDTITAGDSTLTANNNSTGNGNVQNTLNWNSGGSQGQYFTEQANGSAMPNGVSEEVINDSGANLTGTLQDGITDLTAGGSIDQIFAGLSGNESSLFNFYTGQNDTGKYYQENITYTPGNSTVELYTPTSAITNETYDYSGSNGSGTDNENIINWVPGGSQEQLFTGLPNGVTADYYGYSGSNLTGTQQSQQVVNAANGNGQVWVDVSGTGATCSLNNVYIQLSGNATCTVTGQNDSIILTGGCTVNLTGSSDTVSCQSGNYNTVDLNGSSDTATLNGTHETVDSTVSGDTINLSGSNGTWDTVAASHDTLNLGTQDDLSLTGSTNTIVGSYDVMDFSGTYNTLNTSYSVISDFNTAGDWLTGYYDMYDGTNESGYYNGADPIVLNLSGQQVQTVGIAQSGAFFDMQNDGQRILTGWATAGEGFLVYDSNNTNAVTNEESLVSSFSTLQALDSNHDGVLNASDAAWSKLKVWLDAAGIGNYSSSSLYTLAQLGITSINLNAAQESQNSNGNTIVADSTFTFTNGSTGDIAAVNFVNAPDITMGVNGAIFQQANNAFNQLVSAIAAAPPASSASAAVAANSQYAASIASLAAPTVGAH